MGNLMSYQTDLKSQTIEDGIMFSKDLLSGKYGFMCQYDKKLNFDTIWASIFNLTSSEIYRAEGNPGRTKYLMDERFKKCIKTSA